MKNIFSSLKLNKVTGIFKKKKFLYGTIAAAVLLIICGYFFWGGSKQDSTYITSTVKKGTVSNTIPATGTIEPVSTVSLSFENAEIIRKIYVKVGDYVTAGQLLAEQEEDDLQAQVSQSSASLKSAAAKLADLADGATEEEIIKAETSVKTAQNSYDQAKTNLERYQQLFQAGAVSRADLDSAESTYISAESSLKQAEAALRTTLAGATAADLAAAEATYESSSAQLKMAQKELTGAKMTSPMNGIVSVINGGEGQRATANNNTTSSSSGFMTVISEKLQVEAKVNEADIGSLKIGQTAELTVNAFPNKTFTGKVSSVSPIATTVSNVQVYDTVITLDDNQNELKAGMPATITIIVEESEDVLTVPKGAVTYAAKQSAGTGNGPGRGASVIVMDKSGNLSTRPVVLGLSDSSSYEVKEGLSEGETVVIGAGSGNSGTSGSGTNPGSGSGGSSGNNRGTGGAVFMGGPPR
ncbi:efflux RND transporter periplasmic adaptor subunit [Pelotomaculum propionicicum]|uniref:efflux RND transporter periplasmic adaptor subunit n=1 Tax=Pelotomaculum propionicicum TaxID=258475 RepID=UPI003B7787E3